MDASRRLSTLLRLACGLILAVGLSVATATTATGEATAKPAPTGLSHLAVTAAPAQAVMRAGTAVRLALTKHRTPAMAGAFAVVAITLTGLAAVTVRRRRTDPALRHYALSHGARAPPAVSDL